MCSPNGFLDIVCSGVRLESWKLTFRICWHQQNRLRSAYWHMTSQINLGIMQKVAALHCTLSVREPFAGDDTSNGSNGSWDFTTSIPLTFLNFHPKSSWSRDFTNISQWEILKHLNCYLDAENDPSLKPISNACNRDFIHFCDERFLGFALRTLQCAVYAVTLYGRVRSSVFFLSMTEWNLSNESNKSPVNSGNPAELNHIHTIAVFTTVIWHTLTDIWWDLVKFGS